MAEVQKQPEQGLENMRPFTRQAAPGSRVDEITAAGQLLDQLICGAAGSIALSLERERQFANARERLQESIMWACKAMSK